MISGSSNREQDGLLGPVRRARTETATVSTKDGKLVESPRVLLETTTYDLRGNRTDNTYYAVAGNSLTGREIYKYDTKGNIIEMIVRDANGSILNQEVYSYEFDAVGNWTKMITSVAIIEAGKLTYEPTEVTYRTISYYRTDAVVRMIASSLIAPQSATTTAANASGILQQTPNLASQISNAGKETASEAVAIRNAANNTTRPSTLNTVASTTSEISPDSSLSPGASSGNATGGETASSSKTEGERPAARLIESPTASQPPTPSTTATTSEERINPKALRLPVPVYPEFARSVGVRGMVRVEIVIDEKGRVTSAHALSGPAQLQQAAVNAALQAQFSPAMRAGKPVQIAAVIGYNFVFPQ
ncbi:MAG: energy transducer TonB [Pyrinomonadaceae bacterium]|nr:energy transducer TonB [Pyrinomonadaceae bacterium]